MKTILRYFFLVVVVALQSCTAQREFSGSRAEQMLAEKEYQFVAARAYPNSATFNNVINQLPGATASQILNLQSRYAITFTPEKISADLPYFGRAFTASMDRDRQGIKFDSKSFRMTLHNRKKSSVTYRITPSDVRSVSEMYLQVFENGRAYLSVNFTDREPISFDGTIEAFPAQPR